MAGLLGGGGGGPLDSVTGAASGLTSGGGPLGSVTDVAGGALGGGPLDSVTGLAGGLGGGLLGGGEGLNLIGVVGVGSDEKAILDLNPAQKKEVKAKNMQIAKAREQERQRQRKQIEELTKQQGGKPTEEQKKILDSLDKSEADDKAGMDQINRLIPEDVGDNATNGLGGGNSGGPLGAANGLTGGGGPLGAASGLTGGGGPLGAANNLTGSGGPLGAANGLTGGGGPLGAANGLTGGGGPLGAASGLTGGGGPLGAANGLTGSGGPLGAVGGLTGDGGPLGAVSGLLGSGEGLNVAGLVGVGSDDPALLDLNPAQKKAVKAQKAAEFQKRQQERQQQQKALENLHRQQGGLSPAQRAQYDKLTAENNADLQQAQNYEKWLDQPGRGAESQQSGQSNTQGSQGASGGSYSASSGCIPICGHTMNNYASNTGLFYAYLVDAERRDPSKPASYLMTFANADTANQWYSQIGQAGYNVQQHGPQFYSFQGNAPYPVSYDQRFSSSNIGHRMMITGIKQDGCQMVIPPQNQRGYLVPHDVGRVAIVNGPCPSCGAGNQTSSSSTSWQNSNSSGSFNNSGFTNSTSTGNYGNTTSNLNNSSGDYNSGGFGGQPLPGNQGQLGNGISNAPTGGINQGSGNSGLSQGNNNFGSGSNSFNQGNGTFNQGTNSSAGYNNSTGNSFGSYNNSTGNTFNNASNSSMTSSGSGGGLSLEKAAWIAAREAKNNGDPRPLDVIAQDNYNQLKGSCCGSQQQGGGGIVPGNNTGYATQPRVPQTANSSGDPMNAATGQPSQQQGGGQGGGLGSALGGLPGGLGGLGGGLLGSGQGLNVAGIVGLGSDDPALLDLNPATKKAVKQQRMQTLDQVKQQEAKKMQDLERQVQQQGGQATPAQKAQYEQARKNIEAAETTKQGLANSLPVDDAAIAGLAGGALSGISGGGGPLGAVGGLGGGLLG